MAFVLALIVMYDATGVRWAAGLHAKAINYIVEYLGDENTKDKEPTERNDPEAERIAWPPHDRGGVRRAARICDLAHRVLLLLKFNLHEKTLHGAFLQRFYYGSFLRF